MRTEPIDMDEAISLLERARDTQGADFVYRGSCVSGKCHYIPITREDFAGFYTQEEFLNLESANDPRLTTGCLIGVALDLAGETRHHSSRFFGGNVDALWTGIDDLFTNYDVVSVLDAAQVAQDAGKTWGEAVEAAKYRLAQIQHQETIV